MKRLRHVYIWWSASYVFKVKFVRWCRMRMLTGREDTNKIGVGIIVESELLFGKWKEQPIPYGLKRNQDRIRPYIKLYRSNSDAWQHKRAICRPEIRYVHNN